MNSDSLSTEYETSWGLAIGINEYVNMPPLSGAANDASAIADVLVEEFRFPDDQVLRLLDQDATRAAIREKLEWLSENAHTDDRVVVFFAGHGCTRRRPNGKESGYLATVESEPGRWHTFLKIDDITSHRQFMPAKHILYVFDACFSGLALMRSGTSGEAPTEIKRWVRDAMTHRAAQVLTAGLAEQPVGDITEDGHSIFTSHLLDALCGKAAGSEGEITASRVVAYVTEAVKKDDRSQQSPAFGDLKGSEPGGDLIFRRPDLFFFTVPADREEGINTGIHLVSNDRIVVSATGVITYDSGHHFTNPDGLLTTYKGQPLAHPQAIKPMAWPHPRAFTTDTDQPGIIGSLFGWIGEYSANSAFYLGGSRELTVEHEGDLHLAVNDAVGTYGDNRGEYDVVVRVFR